MTRIGLLPALAVTLAAPLAAQQVNPAVAASHGSWNRGLVHYGKWVSAALAVTFIGLGAREHASSDDAFSQLLDSCHADPANCALSPSGSYVNPASEQLYQMSTHFERRARVRLLAGQASLLLAAGLFLADHGRHADEPDNIPYHGLTVAVEPQAGAARLGVQLRF
jgi:hypothetical protein